MSDTHLSSEEREQLLQQAKTIAVVGLSANPMRDSYGVAAFMQQQGYKIIPVNPTLDEVLGEKAVASLKEIEQPVDIVNVFRRGEHLMPIVQEAVEIGAKTLWLQLGVYNEEASAYAKENGMNVIENTCLKVDYQQLSYR